MVSHCCVTNHYLCIGVVPRIIRPSADNHRVNAYKSDSISLTCSLNINIPSSVMVTWTSNNTVITIPTNKIIKIESTTTTLQMENLQLSDAGVYQCVFNDAANGWTLRKTITLLITGMLYWIMFIARNPCQNH